MKKWVALFFVCIFANSFSQTNISPQFSELKGMEDQLGNTHLFYRIYTAGYGTMGYYYSNSIWRLEPFTGIDTFFLGDGGFADLFDQVNDYEFWMNDFSKYIYAGTHIYIEPSPEVYRYDQLNPIFSPQMWGTSRNIELSRQDTNIVIVSVDNGFNYRSTDWGNSWDSISLGFEILSLSPFNHNIIFAAQGLNLLKSTDGGNSFFTVDTGKIYTPNFTYDPDALHIYALDSRFGNHLVVSNNKGEPGSWMTKFSDVGNIHITIDENNSGTIYLADKRKIYGSDNYGSNFIPILKLESDIVGLYIKPYSKFLFAATQYRIYEINLWEDSLKIIKSITPVSENYGWFPLNIGNYWVYSVYTSEGGQTIYWGDETRAIVDTQTSNPGSQVFVYQSKYVNGDVDTTYLKLDSLSGKLYASSSGNGDYLLFDDLTAETGDTVCYEYNPAWNCQYVQLERDFTEFGINTIIKDYYPQAPGWYFGHSLVKGIGLYEVYNGDLTTYRSTLKGCILDGVVYGDTTTVSVEDEENPIAKTFTLEQNYPNPFNPSTKIKFTIPRSPLLGGDGRGGLVTLKVYDVLGNEIATLVNEEKPAGEYEVKFDASSGIRNLVSGVYFYQIKSGSFVETKKMILLK